MRHNSDDNMPLEDLGFLLARSTKRQHNMERAETLFVSVNRFACDAVRLNKECNIAIAMVGGRVDCWLLVDRFLGI